MANADWLMTLLSGVGGAFTGASVANERRSREAELARQVARQAQMDERQAKLDAESAFDRGIQRESVLGELGYERGTIPRTGPAMMQLPGMGALDVGSVMDARIGPQMTTPDGASYTLNRFQTPRARAASAATMSREEARAQIERQAAENAAARKFTAEQNDLNRKNALNVASLRTTNGSTVPSTDPLARLSPAERERFRTRTAALGEMKQAIQQYRDLLSTVGVTAMPSGQQARMMAAYTNLQMKAKNAAQLGALSGPDMGLLQVWVTPPSSFAALGRDVISGGGGTKQLLAQLQEYENSIDNDARTTLSAFGVENFTLPGQEGSSAQVNGRAFVEEARKNLSMGGRR